MKIDQIHFQSLNGEEIGPANLNKDLSVMIGDSAAGKTRTLNVLFNLAFTHKQPKVMFVGHHSIIFSDENKKYNYELITKNAPSGKIVVAQDSLKMISPEDIVYFDREKQILFNESTEENEKYSPIEDELSVNYVKDAEKHATVLRIKDYLTRCKRLDYSLGSFMRAGGLHRPDVLMVEPDGTLLDAAIVNMSKNYPKQFAVIGQHFRTMFPTVEALTVGPYLPNPNFLMETLLIKESILEQPYPYFEASSGMVKALAILSILFSPLGTSLVLMDELENSLDYKRLSVLADIIKDASTDKQIVIATHSPILANLFRLESWIIVRRDRMKTKFCKVRVDDNLKDLIKRNFEDYSLYVQDLIKVDEHQ